MNIIVAENAGFCFGVNRAIKTINELIENDNAKVYTLGPIIHNRQLVNNLEKKGVRVVENIEKIEPPGCVVIRAHGVIPEIYDRISEKGLEVVDVTCPYVKKIHHLVCKKHNEGYRIIIIGDKKHPEVVGINGWCVNEASIVNSKEDIDSIEDRNRKTCVVAQTTTTQEKWENLTEYIDKRFENVIKFDTICSATINRQTEGLEIASKVDIMMVIGGCNSSNTQKLYEICKKKCPVTLKIETFTDLPSLNIGKNKNIGITAGASTPDWIIKEVVDRMEELKKQVNENMKKEQIEKNDLNEENNQEEQNENNEEKHENTQKHENEKVFREALDDSIVTLRPGQIVKGKIIGFNENEIYVDLGYKSDGTIPVEEYTDEKDFNPENEINVGDEIEVYIVNVDDKEGIVKLSKKLVEERKGWSNIRKAYKDATPIEAEVIEVVKGGVLAKNSGIRIFIPASHVSDRYVKDLGEFLKTTIKLRIIEFNRKRGKVVGSRRVLIEEEKEQKVKELWENIEEGREYTGEVTGLTDFGAFVDIGGVDGLIHLTELSWTKIKHPSEVMSVGDTVDVRVLEYDREKERISLGYRKDEDNPWNNVNERYSEGDIVKGHVVRLVPFGAFVELEKGVDGLVHISQISSRRIGKPDDVLKRGEEVEAKVLDVDGENQRISLSIKEVNPMDPPETEDDEQQKKSDKKVIRRKPVKRPKLKKSNTRNSSNSHTEDMSIKIGDMLGNLNLEEHVQSFNGEEKEESGEEAKNKAENVNKEKSPEKVEKETIKDYKDTSVEGKTDNSEKEPVNVDDEETLKDSTEEDEETQEKSMDL